ncbi:class I SAM-dependent methyltransferase [Natroniella sp. ANB-PHB2]|uniref:class I SAM-dependent methyltransferase n=1 Tax=Natroniella sp. ANB-PHB2 TaxID=3384444 RepID=UPI0038D44177
MYQHHFTRKLNKKCDQLPFLDDSFDLIACRNLVCKLVEPEKIYQEWHRVLKEGAEGLLLSY